MEDFTEEERQREVDRLHEAWLRDQRASEWTFRNMKNSLLKEKRMRKKVEAETKKIKERTRTNKIEAETNKIKAETNNLKRLSLDVQVF